jgi:hypothetical protein
MASDTLLAPLLGYGINTANQTILSQREPCQEALPSTRNSILESLDSQSPKLLIEASSLKTLIEVINWRGMYRSRLLLELPTLLENNRRLSHPLYYL